MTQLLLPPGLFFIFILFSLLVLSRFRKTGLTFMLFGFVFLFALSIPLVATNLTQLIEYRPALDIKLLQNTKAEAIVILAGGKYIDAPEFQADTVARHTLQRIRYGAYLQRKSKLPILVSGGIVYPGHDKNETSEAELMKAALEDEFIAIVRWVENKSRTTYENAIFTQAMLAQENVKHIILVTHASHMYRSKEAFEKSGLIVTPAPTGFSTKSSAPLILSFLPSASALSVSSNTFHELLGRLWYNIRYY